MLKAYIDESGHSSDPRCQFVGMGGLVAPSSQWERFTVEWRNTLDEFIGGAPFHMRDFVYVPSAGIYAGWKEDKRRAFFARLINAIINSNARRIGCVVSMEGFSKLSPVHQTIFKDPYYLCFQQVTHGCTICGLDLERATPEDLFAGGEVAMVYALQEQFGAIKSGSSRHEEQGRAESLWHTMKATNRFFGKLMASYASELAGHVPALQAADLFAYEITKEFENRVSRPQDRMRWGLRQLLQNDADQPLIKFYGLPTLLESLMDSRELPEDANVRIASSMMQLDAKLELRWRYNDPIV